jgi:hypothetical protein
MTEKSLDFRIDRSAGNGIKSLIQIKDGWHRVPAAGI